MPASPSIPYSTSPSSIPSFSDHHLRALIGTPIKLDVHTGTVDRGRYARLCVEISCSHPLPKSVRIGNFLQDVHYVMHVPFCSSCGILGHAKESCELFKTQVSHLEDSASAPPSVEEKWHTVIRKHTRGKKSEQLHSSKQGLVSSSTSVPIRQEPVTRSNFKGTITSHSPLNSGHVVSKWVPKNFSTTSSPSKIDFDLSQT
ncbi:zinc ion binding / nucleic acid binding protein [Corchorus olitorius]|uniref:Zinc ion binding / nucleic acid binding protein n=1 Tax=Corchorus olitorius TaxID=93759 RepID=A0A1R3K2E2_9ROSI|nr:zinc ion binding / nucleic acid binding protein [Corchorus olitorius]